MMIHDDDQDGDEDGDDDDEANYEDEDGDDDDIHNVAYQDLNGSMSLSLLISAWYRNHNHHHDHNGVIKFVKLFSLSSPPC